MSALTTVQGMHLLIATGRDAITETKAFRLGDFVRVERSEVVERKKTKPEKPPEPEQPPELVTPEPRSG